MVNHFASLLGNFQLVSQRLSAVPYVVGDTDPAPDEVFSFDDDSSLLSLDETYTALRYVKSESAFIYKDYYPISLPKALQDFHNILFKEPSSLYYKHFLLFNYLRLLEGTMLASEMYKYDSRVTYDLDDSREYFRFTRNSSVLSSNPMYPLFLHGNLTATPELSYYLNSFVVQQAGNTNAVFVFSTTDGKYLKEGREPSSLSEGMDIPLSISSVGSTERVNIGFTGLSFNITGPFDVAGQSFGNSRDKTWTFTAETSFKFALTELLDELFLREHVVSNMLKQPTINNNASYENIWNTHFNAVYRFAGLLLAYVERVHFVWQSQMSK